MQQPVRVLAIRHAESLYNNRAKQASKLPYEEFLKQVKYSRDLINCPITQRGLSQCRAAKQALPAGIEFVFVSPLKRTIQTALAVFGQTTPMQLLPEAREILQSYCDAVHSIDQIYQDAKPFIKVPANFAADFYNSFPEPDKANSIEHVLKQIQICWSKGHAYEDNQKLWNRSRKLRAKLKQAVKERGLTSVALVVHSRLMTFLFAHQCDQNFFPKDPQYFQNCEIRWLQL